MNLPALKMTAAEYLAWEATQEVRHEFWRGEVFAMVGARRVHGLVALNLAAALKSHLKGTPCRAFIEGQKVQVAQDAIFYPDVFVTCNEDDLRTDVVFKQPKLVVEVLSDSTQAFDRSLKFAAYRQLASLEEYVLVDPDSRVVEVFRRNERGNFELLDQTGAAALELASVGLQLPMAELFDGVEAADEA
ncbi:MAG: Uma2 family endonuclease [Rubrivivax sp.]|nr:MAG: Uma2 family endonuclease [Rubrivivax sp.]